MTTTIQCARCGYWLDESTTVLRLVNYLRCGPGEEFHGVMAYRCVCPDRSDCNRRCDVGMRAKGELPKNVSVDYD